MINGDWRIFVVLMMFAVAGSIIIGVTGKTLTLNSFDELRDDAEVYNDQAFALLDEHTLGESLGNFKKPPGYSLFLTIPYGLFGRHLTVAWVAQVLLFIGALFMLWRMSNMLFDRWVAVMPLLGISFFWGITFYVFKMESEILALFLVTLLIYTLFWKWNEDVFWRKTVACGAVFAFLVLTKPIFLYVVPIIVYFLVRDTWRRDYKCATIHAAVFITIIALASGGWMIRNYLTTGDYQIEQNTGHIIWGRGGVAELSTREVVAYTTASLFGNLVADYVFPGYAEFPVPSANRRYIIDRIHAMRDDGVADHEINAFFLAGGVEKIRQNPIKYIVTTVPGIFELNALVNHRGFSLVHVFIGTHEEIPRGVKFAIIGMLRTGWLLFLGVAVYGMVQAWKSYDRRWHVFIFLVLYVNIIYALIIAPVEPRFLVPVLPFYFLFFVMGIHAIIEKLTRRKMVSI
ncbi:MAG: hypothetical protein COU90_02075 [Candidatus Ryanbacteria bacterium CG10_big_fil_rev_8_21_14_0_10_43_42]|uniref:Glycosyltransferase RgtA/B/C/D-like domain-containing protein n=1 Tax=Candidatus Ryanbacteria bacterium CG10_big_fil_rev_8_21_14_0_10_43_42 TaxID=1974864 RepID=A0A2M8KXE5_9BACT|nr:MAG: hypothetical protein COU90_02075 [Candidatus Ryanbacteria bacterium CG10_big_fil_rev_8_21_14_0_10_43_42]